MIFMHFYHRKMVVPFQTDLSIPNKFERGQSKRWEKEKNILKGQLFFFLKKKKRLLLFKKKKQFFFF